MIKNKRALGENIETEACRCLIKNGYRIIERNFRVGRFGEVDIIASEGESICFVEVKGRSSDIFGTPAEAVNFRKQATIRKLASIYLGRTGNSEINIRFDVAEVYFKATPIDFRIERINLIKNAF
ncbi:MAG: YraN family protein [Eubacteriales bacterium]|nr:YraN family protein [Eubacteriales bacterium]